MKVSQILATVAALSLAIGLTACGGTAAPSAQTGSQPAAQSPSGGSTGGSPPAAAQAAPTAAPTAAQVAAPTAAPRPAVQPTSAPAQQASTGISDLASRAQGAGDYTYDTKMTVQSMETSGKVFVKGAKMRQELTTGAGPTVQIIDTGAKAIYTLMADQKVAVKLDLTQVQGGTISPTEQVSGIPADARLIGSETVDGKQTAIYQYTKDGTTGKLWIWTEKGLPLRVELDISGITVKMTNSNYTFAPLDAALFQVPAGFTVMDRPTTRPPVASGPVPPVPGAPVPATVAAAPTRAAAATAQPAATSQPAAAATAAPTKPVVVLPAPTPTQVSTVVAPPLANPSVLPAELKTIPIPPGFGIVDKSVRRSASGGVFSTALMQLWGNKSIDEVLSFYATALAAEWTPYNETVNQDSFDISFVLTRDESRWVQFSGQSSAEGLYIDVRLKQD